MSFETQIWRVLGFKEMKHFQKIPKTFTDMEIKNLFVLILNVLFVLILKVLFFANPNSSASQTWTTMTLLSLISFINFELAASSPISDDPPDPFITEFSSSNSDPPVGSSGIEERIGSFSFVEKEVDENESSGVRGKSVAIDDVVGMESEDSEVRDDVIATDDESRGDVIVNDDEIRGEIVSKFYEIRGGIMGVDDAVGDG